MRVPVSRELVSAGQRASRERTSIPGLQAMGVIVRLVPEGLKKRGIAGVDRCIESHYNSSYDEFIV